MSPRKEKKQSGKGKNVGMKKETEEYTTHKILGHSHDSPTKEGKELRKLGVVLHDNFLVDKSLRLKVEWKGYHHPEQYTDEPVKNLFYNYNSRLHMMQYLKAEYLKKEDTNQREVKTEEENNDDWTKFRDDFQLKYISAVEDIVPLAAQFTGKDKKEVKVRVESLRSSFHSKVVNGKNFKRKYVVTWDDNMMFAWIPTKDYQEIYPHEVPLPFTPHSKLLFPENLRTLKHSRQESRELQD
ncbi:hypothetical protein PMAYCL1PPCAC_23434 [Pristionchus mayeri]|uniref:Chromo domain-containing protein n=1 Tax=Pristionchus mayeri TaxID=1317129 RepID=A0AAN5CYX9_9BILA|nr:hypothetical protein PMAYCL1PPCAC_23434 [Pristionchus mayeri]